MKVIATVLGHFGNGLKLFNGQTVKTKVITEELIHTLGTANIQRVDTHGGIRSLLKAPVYVTRAIASSQNVIILPAQNGLRVYTPLLRCGRLLNKDIKLHYIVIGGWLPDFLRNRSLLSAQLKLFDYIYVETSSMKTALEDKGFTNVVIMPNCKKLHILKEEDIVFDLAEPLKLCTFSRVMEEKGIEDAVKTVQSINKEYGREVYKLDIYGQVDSSQLEWFEKLKNSFTTSVRYRGIVDYGKSVDILKEYFALLFPTHFFTEGIPGTIIDAFSAGIPVISSKWENYKDIIKDDATGIGYDFYDAEGLKNVLCLLADHPERVIPMKTKCIHEAEKYMPEQVVKIVLDRL